MAFYEVTQFDSLSGCAVMLDVVSRSSSRFTATLRMTKPWTGNIQSRTLDRLILAASSDPQRPAYSGWPLEGLEGPAGISRQ